MMTLDETDVRKMIRLLGEVAALAGDHADKKYHLMSGVCELIGADAWSWTLGQQDPQKQQAMASPIHDGFKEGQFVKLLKAVEHPDSMKAAGRFYIKAQSTMKYTTMDELEMDPERLALQGGLGELWLDTGFGPCILSGLCLDETSMSVISIYRSEERPYFSEREKMIAHLILEEVPWLHMQGWSEERDVKIPTLSPQQRIVLNLLLEGSSRKHIAAQLEISENTVSGYVKEVFRHFSVNSHPELMGKFLRNSSSS